MNIYEGKYFKADVASTDGKFRLYDLNDNKLLEVSEGSVFSGFGYGYAISQLENAIRELEEIKEKIDEN